MADDKLKNFIPISRKIFSHELWEESREFSKFEAWVDLIQTARFETKERSEWINNREVKYGRGQLIGSIRFLKNRWNWGSNTKVENYLLMLKNKDMVDLKKGQGVNVITICKYDDYNNELINEKTQEGRKQGRRKDKTNIDNNKEYNNSNYDIAFQSYSEMRKLKKSPMTESAKNLIEDKLEKLSGGNEELKIKILNNSTANSWTGVFELKENNNLFSKTQNLDQIEM